jgi:glutathione reductase (NADPH)
MNGMAYDYDLIIIGAGSAGLAAAKQSAAYGATVAIAESGQLGGVCTNRGCIPKKLLAYAAEFARSFADASNYGWSFEAATSNAQFDWQRFVTNRDREIERIHQAQQQALSQAGVNIICERATFLDAHTVRLGDRCLSADKILIAVGGMPSKPDIPGIEHALTSDQMFGLRSLPSHLAILGGGYIGVEFASALHALGVAVTLIDREAGILTGFDRDLSAAVQTGLTQRGIRILCNTTAKQIQQVSSSELKLYLSGECPEPLTVDTVLCAIGRTPNLESLNLEQAGVELNGKAIAVDVYSRTSQAHIYATGDCTDRLALTPAARAEGQAFADTVFGNQPRSIDYASIPSAVFTYPEAAAVGMTEAQARSHYGSEAIELDRIEFIPLFDRLSDSPQPALCKQVYLRDSGKRDSGKRDSGKIVGIHIVGNHAAEMIQGMALALNRGITKRDVKDTIGIHPTSTEEFFE